ncbi:MAG: ATP--guanido phosphotransferase, partial [Endomicrobiia bacterium]
MKLNELAKKKIGWIEPEDKKNLGIVLSTRIRLARNLFEKPFPGRANKSIQIEVFDKLVDAINNIHQLKNAYILKLMEYDKIDRRLLMERHLISHELATKKEGEPGVIFTPDEKISIMVNEEDHYRIQIISSGLSAIHLWNVISKIDDELNKKLNFAFHKRFGFLTACPTNVGSGLRVSCLMHIPALVLTNEIEKLIQGLQ